MSSKTIWSETTFSKRGGLSLAFFLEFFIQGKPDVSSIGHSYNSFDRSTRPQPCEGAILKIKPLSPAMAQLWSMASET